MSNPSDPKKPTPPNQPNPANSGGSKPDGTPNEGEREHTGRSSFDFELPPEAKSGDIPPLEPPETDPNAIPGKLPPRPSTSRPSSGSFDFIELPDVDLASLPGTGVHRPSDPLPAPLPPVLSPSDSVLDLPAIPPIPAAPVDEDLDLPFAREAGESSLSFELPIPVADPASFTVGNNDMADLGTLPEVRPDAPASDIASIPDISTLFPTSDPPSSFVLGKVVTPPPVSHDSSGSFVLPASPPPPAEPGAESIPDLSSVFPEPVSPAAESSFFGLSPPARPDLQLPTADSGSYVFPDPTRSATTPPPSKAPAAKTPDSAVAPRLEAKPGTPTPDLESVVGDLGVTPFQPIEPVRGWVEESKTPAPAEQSPAPPPAEPVSDEDRVSGRSSFDFVLPEGVQSYSDLPPVPQPEGEATGIHKSALPPRPSSTRPVTGTFDFINLSDADIELPPAPTPPAASATPAAEPPLLTPTDSAVNLPPGYYDPEAAVGNVEPVAPASGWIDSDVLSIPPAPGALVPTAEPAGTFDPAPADIAEGSDIFAKSQPKQAESVEQSDVIAATAFGSATPADSGRPVDTTQPSDVALNFDSPPGGSTLEDSGMNALPIADEALDLDSDDLTSVGGPDHESIHDMSVGGPDHESIHDLPDPAITDPLFDSSRLAATPDLPVAPISADDATDYGNVPSLSPDASSILADLSDPEVRPPGTDSSSVRVEAPGMGRTLTSGPVEGAFDLTVPDEPVPADLFGESGTGTLGESTDWQSQSGSDLFAETRKPTKDDSGTIESDDIDLGSGPASLGTAQSSIFTGPAPTTGATSGNVRIGSSGSSDITNADADEFTAEPALNETAEREKGIPPAVPPKQPRRPSSGEFEMPVEPAEDGGAIDWDAAALSDDENATRGIPQDASLSAVLRGLGDDSGETPTRDGQPVVPPTDEAGTPVVTVDWMSASAEEPAVAPMPAPSETAPTKVKEKDKPKEKDKKKVSIRDDAPPPAETPKAKPSRPATPAGEAVAGKDKPAKKGGMLVGVLLGGLLAGGAAAGVHFSGILADKPATKVGDGGNNTGNNGQTGPQQPPPPIAGADPQSVFASGDSAAALKMLNDKPPTTTAEKATAGYVRVFAKVQELGAKGVLTAAADDADLKQARADLEAVLADAEAAKTAEGEKRAVAATVQLGVSHEIAGDTATARKLYTDAIQKFSKYAPVFEAMLEKLDATEKTPGTSRAPLTPDDAQRVLFALTLLLADEPGKSDDPEAGTFYWKAVNQAAAGRYTEAIDLIGKAKTAHVKRAKTLAGRGLNPLTDPLEQMFPRACDELAAYWKLRSDVYSNPAVAAAIKKDGLVKTLDTLGKAQTELVTAKAETTKALDAAKIAEKAKTEAEDKLKVAQTDLKTAQDNLKTTQADLKTAQDGLKVASADLKTAQDGLKAAQADAKAKSDTLVAIATELKPAVTLPENWKPADLIAGVKSAANRGTGPDLRMLVPNTMVAIGGGGLATGQLLDIASRMTKAEADAKAAADKLVAETKRLNDKYDTDTAKLKTDHAAELKKLTDGYAADLKKVKDGNADEIKKLSDKFAADTKKLNDDHATAIKVEQAKTEAEKAKVMATEIAFQKQLAGALTPSQVLDVWLPRLTDLRRASDSEAALAAGNRALTSAVPDSDDAGKARTVNGMALLLKGDLSGAKEQFQAAKRNPAYKADKPWAKIADAGLDATEDPLAPYRQPVIIPPIDLKAAAKSLDLGIAAYKAGKYASAASALADAAKNDPSDPVAWYYLGASRWAMGDTKQAAKDFDQGAEREKVSPIPARTVSAALAPIQGETRAALDRARP